MRAPSWLAVTFGIGLACVALDARAEETPGERLFREGREALGRSELELACKKFRESYDVEKALGPLLNLANCEENRGRLVAARTLWTESRSLSTESSEARTLANERLLTLDKDIPRLVIQLATGSPAATRVELDGQLVTLGPEPLLVDPGSHSIVARLGAQEDRKQVTAERGGLYTVELRIDAAAATNSKPSEDTGPSAGWIAGWIVGGVGVASGVGFAVTGGLILDKSSQWDDEGCPDDPTSDRCVALEPGTGMYAANAVLAGVGLAGVGVGIILLVTQPAGSSKDAALTVQPGPGDVGLALGGSF
ncbi:MAG: hypothetical protein IPG04_32595 [Polyangiaceae bacterium]|nr:hypothetical protein [Polyangiaceae bacterium]